MFDDLRRLNNALERASEDLAASRVLVDTALRQIEDLIAEALAVAPHGEEVRP
jgi:hypothetical protein